MLTLDHVYDSQITKPARIISTRRTDLLSSHRGEIEAEVAGERCKINIAVNTLDYSRHLHIFATPNLDAEHTY